MSRNPSASKEPFFSGRRRTSLTSRYCPKPKPFDITELLALIIRDIPLDKFNPALSLLQALYEPADAAVYARLLVRRTSSRTFT